MHWKVYWLKLKYKVNIKYVDKYIKGEIFWTIIVNNKKFSCSSVSFYFPKAK